MTSGFRRAVIVPQTPAGPPMSLLDAAIIPGPDETDLDGRPMRIAGANGQPDGYRWEAGFAWKPRQCPPINGRNECAPAATASYRTDGESAIREHQPVIIEAQNPCTAAMVNDWAFERQSTHDALIAGEAAAVEQELWDGTLAAAAITAGDTAYAQNLWLTKHGVATDVTPTPGTGVSPQRGLGLLEQFLSSTGVGGWGTIHCQPEVLAHFNYDLHPSGRQLFSARNTLIVPGVGYTGNGPAASNGGAPVAPAAGNTWMYATGRITYRAGEIQVFPDVESQALNRSVNSVTITAQRSTAATWDLCAVGAVLVTLPA